jgi:hypothetical protein
MMIPDGKLFRVLLAALTLGWGQGGCCCGPSGGAAHADEPTAATHHTAHGELTRRPARPASAHKRESHCPVQEPAESGCHDRPAPAEASTDPHNPQNDREHGPDAPAVRGEAPACDCGHAAPATDEPKVHRSGSDQSLELLAAFDLQAPVLRISPARSLRRFRPLARTALPDPCLTDSLLSQHHTLLTT